MPTTPQASRVLTAVLNGAATTAYYASPDLLRSRAARGWVKAGLTAVLVAGSVPDMRRGKAAARAAQAELPEEERVDWAEAARTMPARGKVAAAAVAAALVGGSVASVVVAERWIFRRGEARRAAGVPYAHTRAALLWGAVAAGLALIPDPDERRGAPAR